MLNLKKLLYPEVKDVCPNCGEACAITDVLCPKCGKNLDELFEQLPESVSSMALPKWIFLSRDAKVNRIWRLLNSFILIMAFISPWIIVYSDVFPSEPFTLIGLRVFIISISNGFSYMFFLDCFSCLARGLIAIGYLSLMIYTILNFFRASPRVGGYIESLQKASIICVIVSILFFLQIVTPMMLSGLAWGYWLACVGLLSSLWLEVTERVSSKLFVAKISSKAA
jgi:hypothetical protein